MAPVDSWQLIGGFNALDIKHEWATGLNSDPYPTVGQFPTHLARGKHIHEIEKVRIFVDGLYEEIVEVDPLDGPRLFGAQVYHIKQWPKMTSTGKEYALRLIAKKNRFYRIQMEARQRSDARKL